MTGFGSTGGEVEGVEYAVEVRSVNNRYLKVICKLPESWSTAEADIEKRIRRVIQRGTVTLTVRMRVPDEQATYRVNTGAMSNYLDQLRGLEIEANPTLRVDLGSLLQLPGVCEPPSFERVVDKTRDGLMKLIDEALAGLTEMRKREGDALKEDLLAHCETIDRQLESVSARAGEVVREYHERLTARVQELVQASGASVDRDDLAREVAVFAERCDVAEELSRLGGHVEQFRQALDEDAPAGRKLDFIAQEMLREANTIASKSNNVEIARAVVEMKTAIDRIKEQAQNAE